MAKNSCVLIVDDDLDASESLRELLVASGYDALATFDGPSALALAAKLHPAAVIADVLMPDVDGLELCRRIRAEPWGQGISLVAVSGQANMEEPALRAGFDNFLLKPFVFEHLERLLENRRLQLC